MNSFSSEVCFISNLHCASSVHSFGGELGRADPEEKRGGRKHAHLTHSCYCLVFNEGNKTNLLHQKEVPRLASQTENSCTCFRSLQFINTCHSKHLKHTVHLRQPSIIIAHLRYHEDRIISFDTTAGFTIFRLLAL